MKSAKDRKAELIRKCKEASQKRQTNSFNHLTMPKGIKLLDLKDLKKNDSFKTLYFLPYRVTQKDHPMGIEVGDTWFERTYKVHKNIGVERKTIICPVSFGKRCPICEQVALLKQDYEANKQTITELGASTRQVFNVFDTKDSDIYLMDTSYHQFGKLMEAKIEALVNKKGDESYRLFWDLEDGKEVEILFAEDNFKGMKFWKATEFQFNKRDNLSEDVLDYTVDLDSPELFGEMLSYNQIKDILYCVDDEEKSSSDSKDTQEPRKSLKKRDNEVSDSEDDKPKKSILKKKSDPEPEPEDVPEDEPEPEDKPKKTLKKKSEPENEPENEPEEKPKKSLSLKKKTEPEPEDEPEEKPKKSKKPKDEDDEEECPSGYKYGVDAGRKDECDECAVFDACVALKRKLKKSA